MSFNLIAQRLDFETGGEHIVLLNEDKAIEHGINAGDHIVISKKKGKEIICSVDLTQDVINTRHIGIYRDLYEEFDIRNDEEILINLFQKPSSIEYIKKKIKRHDLSYDEIKAIMQDIVDDRLGTIEKAYFLSTIYNPGYSDDELYYLTKAMAETGDMLKFEGVVADKHSIGGVAGKGLTPLIVSIVASFGVKVPNTSTRSITTPAGTADILETVTKIAFPADTLTELMTEHNAFMVWGGGLELAPADEELIRIERPVGIESYDKFLISIIAKKVAMGITHLFIDIPIGARYKVTHPEDVDLMRSKFTSLCNRFGIKVIVSDRYPKGIDGNGVGPMLEMREVLYILRNDPMKSMEMENETVRMAGALLELAGTAAPNMGEGMARNALYNGSAYMKFKEIIKAQGGNDEVTPDDLTPKSKQMTFKAVVEGTVSAVENKHVIEVAHILGCPLDKKAGLYLFKKPGDRVNVKDNMFTIYSSSEDRLNLALGYIQRNNLFEIVI